MNEEGVSSREKAAKRFIDLLFLNGDGKISIQQDRPLAFSELVVSK
jgi:hypothetical protein